MKEDGQVERSLGVVVRRNVNTNTGRFYSQEHQPEQQPEQHRDKIDEKADEEQERHE
jgi:hypothetical protein